MLFPDPTSGNSLCTLPSSDSGNPTCTGDQTYEKYTYDSAGNRLRLLTRNGDVISYHYDAAGRQDIKTPAGAGAVTTGFNLLGEPLLISEVASGS